MNNKTSTPDVRKRLHVMLIALIPITVQIALFFYIAIWAEGAGSGRGMLGLFSFMVMLIAVPVALVINLLVATYVPQLTFFWMLLFALGIAVLLPVLAGMSLLFGP